MYSSMTFRQHPAAWKFCLLQLKSSLYWRNMPVDMEGVSFHATWRGNTSKCTDNTPSGTDKTSEAYWDESIQLIHRFLTVTYLQPLPIALDTYWLGFAHTSPIYVSKQASNSLWKLAFACTVELLRYGVHCACPLAQKVQKQFYKLCDWHLKIKLITYSNWLPNNIVLLKEFSKAFIS